MLFNRTQPEIKLLMMIFFDKVKIMFLRDNQNLNRDLKNFQRSQELGFFYRNFYEKFKTENFFKNKLNRKVRGSNLSFKKFKLEKTSYE